MKRIGSILVSMLAVSVQAQTPNDSAAVRELQGVEVVARQGVGTTSSLTPVQRLDKTQMLRLNISTLTDALKRMAGVTVRDYGGAGGMKTVSARGIGARHTAVAYDGVALSDCQTGEIDLSRFALEQVEQVELTIGSADEIHRPARNMASAAMLELQTRPLPTDGQPAALHASLTGGSWAMVEPSFWYGQCLGRGWSVGASGDYLYAENDYPFTLKNVAVVTRERRTNSRMSAGHAEAMAMWRADNRHQVDTKIHYDDNLRRLPGIVHYYTNVNDERLHDRTAFIQSTYRGTLDSHWRLKASTKFNWAESDYRNHTPGNVVGVAHYWQREWYATAAVLYAPSKTISLDYSADYLMNSLNSTLTTYGRPHRHTLFQAVAAKAQIQRLSATAHLLSTLSKEQVEGQAANSSQTPSTLSQNSGDDASLHRLSPSVALAYGLLPNEELRLRASWKQTFRLPTFNELYFYHFGTNDLRPERATQWNAGLTWRHAWQKTTECMLTADLYYNKVSDKIIAIPFNMFVWRMMNLANVAVYGADVTLQANRQLAPRHWLMLTGNYSWQQAENRSNAESPYYGRQIAYVPRHSFSATLTWLNPWTNLTLSADGQSHRWATNEHSQGTRIAGFAELDIGAWRTFAWHGHRLTLRASVRNLLDKQYDIVAHYPMPGRSWRVQLTIE